MLTREGLSSRQGGSGLNFTITQRLQYKLLANDLTEFKLLIAVTAGGN